MVELLARPLRLLVPSQDLYIIAFLEIHLAAVAIRVSPRLFLGLLYNYTSRFLPLIYPFREFSCFVPI